MKITAIRTVLAQGERRIFVFVKVETDQPGLFGWGEATVEGKPRAVAGCVQDMEPMILGHNPLDVEHCWQILYRGGFWRQGVIGLSALSGIDQALWDIKGKEAGKPIYELLGGKVRDRVRMYTHYHGSTPDELAESAQSKAAKGWTAVKTVPVPITNVLDGQRVLDEAESDLKAVREAVGSGVDILLDMHGRVTPQMAIRYAQRFEQYEPFCMEEPVQAENPAAMAQVARATTIPIATGERLFTRWGFREILETGAASLLQPDTCHAGGISEVRRIAALAEVYYAGLAPHNPYGPISTAACVHVDLTTPNFVIQEMADPDDMPLSMTGFVYEPLTVVDGHILPPHKPGLGVEIDEAACARHAPDFNSAAVQDSYSSYLVRHHDGGVADS